MWGKGQQSLWAKGEPLMIYGPTGIGKTTIAGQLLMSLINAGDPELLGYPVQPIPDGKTVLYIAADRPNQAMRSLRRMTSPTMKSILNERLRIEHKRQIYASDDPTTLRTAAEQANASVIFLDSTKDIALGPLSSEETAKAFMDNIQECVANNIEVLYLHHPRKGSTETNGDRHLDIDDAHGSTWLTAGAGSVLIVNGKPGAGLAQVEHAKAPAEFVPTFEIVIDYDTGQLTKRTIRDLEEWLEKSGMPTTRRAAAAFMEGAAEEDVDREGAIYKRTVRRLDHLVKEGLANKVSESPIKYQWAYKWEPNPNE